jgi:hypothetical protein
VHHGNLFFWLYENQHIADRKKTVIWLNGGPGCSSEDGVLMEIGPYRLKDEAHLEYNPGSWDKFANIIFVDNPVGTGFSYVDSDSYLHELDEMAAQFMIFLKEFFTIFPEFEEDDVSHLKPLIYWTNMPSYTFLGSLMRANIFPTLPKQYSIETRKPQFIISGTLPDSLSEMVGSRQMNNTLLISLMPTKLEWW